MVLLFLMGNFERMVWMGQPLLMKDYSVYDISEQYLKQFSALELAEIAHLPELTPGYKQSINVRAGMLNLWLQFEYGHLLYAPKSDRLLIQDTFVRVMQCCMQSIKHYEIQALMNTPRASFVYVYFLYYDLFELINRVVTEEASESTMFNVSDVAFNKQIDQVLEKVENYYLFHEFKKINSFLYADEGKQTDIHRAVLKAYKRAYEYLSNENIRI